MYVVNICDLYDIYKKMNFWRISVCKLLRNIIKFYRVVLFILMRRNIYKYKLFFELK